MKKVVVVDDESKARSVLKALISEYCPDLDIVAEAENVPQAVQQINKWQPDIVFSDIEMQGFFIKNAKSVSEGYWPAL